MFTPRFLLNLRIKALKKKTWYKTLDILERSIYNLTLKQVKSVKSIMLGEIIVKIVAKLRGSFVSAFNRLMNSYGYAEARRLSLMGDKFGYEKSENLKKDESFRRFLTAMKINQNL